MYGVCGFYEIWRGVKSVLVWKCYFFVLTRSHKKNNNIWMIPFKKYFGKKKLRKKLKISEFFYTRHKDYNHIWNFSNKYSRLVNLLTLFCKSSLLKWQIRKYEFYNKILRGKWLNVFKWYFSSNLTVIFLIFIFWSHFVSSRFYVFFFMGILSPWYIGDKKTVTWSSEKYLKKVLEDVSAFFSLRIYQKNLIK